MNVRKIIQKHIRRTVGGVDVASDVNAVVSANVGERGSTTAVTSAQSSTRTESGRRSR